MAWLTFTLLLTALLASVAIFLLRGKDKRNDLLFGWVATFFATFIGVTTAALISAEAANGSERAAPKYRIQIIMEEISVIRSRITNHPALLIDEPITARQILDDNMPARLFSLELLLTDPSLAKYSPEAMSELLSRQQNINLMRLAVEKKKAAIENRRNSLEVLGSEYRNTFAVLQLAKKMVTDRLSGEEFQNELEHELNRVRTEERLGLPLDLD